MRTIVRSLSLGIILLWIGTATGSAQGRYDDRDERYRTFGREPLDRVRSDLDRAARHLNYLSSDEMHRFNRVRERIAEFQRSWERGHWNREALDETIGSLRGIVEHSRLRPVDRDILADDLDRLRRLRERHDHGWR